MHDSIFRFGQHVPGYPVPVLNERAVRAAAGITFLFAMVSFMNAWLIGDFRPTRVFVVAFLIDFTLRIFVNPRFAPTLILGQWVVRRQQPEWVGAPQKRFAWAVGFVLALVMCYMVVIRQVVGPLNLVVCAACLMLLFSEAAFGICIGCKVYNWFNADGAKACAGAACEIPLAPGAGGTPAQGATVLVFLGVVAAWALHVTDGDGPTSAPPSLAPAPSTIAPAEIERCRVPEFAKAIGHEEKWKLHNNCR